MAFPVVMYACESWDYKESWAPKNWCFWTVVLEKTLESPFNCKEIKPVNPKENQSWILMGRTDAEAESPVLWPPDVKNWLIWKDPDAGKDWRWEEKGTTGWDGWMASLTWWTWVWVSSGSWWQTGSLACCSPWGCKELTQRLNWTKLNCPGQTAASRGSQRLPVISLSKEELWFCEGQNGNFRDWKMRPCSWVENDLFIWTISLPCSVLSCIIPCSHSPPALPSPPFSSFSQDLRDFTSLRSYSLVAEGASRKRKVPRSHTKDSHSQQQRH